MRGDSHATTRSYLICLFIFTHASAVTEDYSSYESVDEEEPPPEKPAKGKGKGKKAIAPAASKSDGEAAEEKVAKAPPAKRVPTLERKPSKPNVQKGGIASYFTKK